MGIRICSSDDATFLYESVSMRPINTESFASEEDADAFLTLAARRGVAIGSADAAALDRIHDELRDAPKCRECGSRVVLPGDLPDECEGCKPECGFVEYGQRGERYECRERATVVDEDSVYTHCAEHAAAIAKQRARDVAEERV